MSTQVSANVASVKPQNSEKAALVAQLKRLYSVDQQAEFLIIQAEADSLLVELERIKLQQREPVAAQ